MTRKQLFVDWHTLTELIRLKNKSKIMPNQWDENWLADGELEKMVESARQDAKDKEAPTPDSELTKAVIADMRSAFQIEPVDVESVIVLVVIDAKHPEQNVPQKIPCQDGESFAGYVKDVPKDAYNIDCVDYIPLGAIPISFKVSLPFSGHWRMPVPMAKAVVEKLLSKYYKRVLDDAREKYPESRYEHHFMQMLGC